MLYTITYDMLLIISYLMLHIISYDMLRAAHVQNHRYLDKVSFLA